MSSMLKVLIPLQLPGWQFDINTTSPSQTFSMYLGDTANFRVIWGDGSITTFNESSGFKTHVYSTPGTYTLTLKGNTNGLSFYLGSPLLNNIVTKIRNRMNGITGLTGFSQMFRQCINLTGSIPQHMFDSFTNATTFFETFYGCTNLEGPLPDGLFAKNTQCTTFAGTFQSCRNLTGMIPSNLFGTNAACTTVQWTFRGTGLGGNIPSNLFSYMTGLNDCRGTFLNDYPSEIPGFLYLPTNLFDNNLAVTSFLNCFYDNMAMAGFAPKLWERIPAPDLAQCFHNCFSLTNYNDIPGPWK